MRKPRAESPSCKPAPRPPLRLLPVNAAAGAPARRSHRAAAASAAAPAPPPAADDDDDIKDVEFEMASFPASQEVLEEPRRKLKRKRTLVLDATSAATVPRTTRRRSMLLGSSSAVASAPAPAPEPRLAPPPLPPRRARPRLPAGIEDIDLRRAKDPVYCFPYANDSFAFLRELQFRDGPPDSSFMHNRPDGVRPDMRSVLVDWIVEVSEDFAMSSDVLHLSVVTVDRALKTMSVPPSHLQLLGCAAMLLASKFEDVFAPTLTEFVHIADQAYTRDQVLAMECKVLSALGFRLMASTAKPFLRRFQRAARVTPVEKSLSNYVCELTLSNCFYNRFAVSFVAAASVYYARLCLFQRYAASGFLPLEPGETAPKPCPAMWSQDLAWYTGYDEAELGFITRQLIKLVAGATGNPHCNSTVRKYSSADWFRVSSLPALDETALPPLSPTRALHHGGR